MIKCSFAPPQVMQQRGRRRDASEHPSPDGRRLRLNRRLGRLALKRRLGRWRSGGVAVFGWLLGWLVLGR